MIVRARAAALGVLLMGCDLGPGRIVARVTSPDGRVDALVVKERDCGATCETAHGVYLVARGAPLPDEPGYAQLFLNSAEGLRVRWRIPRVLLVEYKRAVVHKFRNEWYLNPRRPPGSPEPLYLVEVRLAPTDTISLPDWARNP